MEPLDSHTLTLLAQMEIGCWPSSHLIKATIHQCTPKTARAGLEYFQAVAAIKSDDASHFASHTNSTISDAIVQLTRDVVSWESDALWREGITPDVRRRALEVLQDIATRKYIYMTALLDKQLNSA